jgi:glycosyltransferase involved in cell wall biosynthesis
MINKVLVIAYYYPPMGLSGVQRTLKFTKYLKDYNWEVTVITTEGTGYYAHDTSMLKEAEEAGVRIIRTSGKDINSLLKKRGTIKMPAEIIRKMFSRLSNTIFIPDNKISWANKAWKKGRELLQKEKFDVIFISGPPFSTFITGRKLKKEFDIPLVIDYRDLWYGNQFIFYATPFHKMMHKKMEYQVLKTADKIISTNRKMKELIMKNFKFLSFEDIYIIPHGFDPSDFEQKFVSHKTNNKLWITYSGLFYEFITPKYFLKGFKKLSIERPDIAQNMELHFIGFLRNENRRLIRKLDLQEYVKEYGYLDHDKSIVKILSCDVLWMMIGKGKNADTISSSKLYEYFGTRKPIIACVPEGSIRTAAEEYKASFITDPEDTEAIKNVFIKIYELYKSNQLPVPDEEFVLRHRRDFLTDQLSKQFLFLVKEEVI